jgi:hypothetical protein
MEAGNSGFHPDDRGGRIIRNLSESNIIGFIKNKD